MIPVVCVGGGGGCFSLTHTPPSHLKKSKALTPQNFFFSQKWENLAKKQHFFENFWPTLEIFTNLL
jgi:hypothetical protein